MVQYNKLDSPLEKENIRKTLKNIHRLYNTKKKTKFNY